MMRNTCLILALGGILGAGASARADYLINPAGGTVLFSDSTDHDDEVVSQSLPFSFDFYGKATSSIFVSTNGNLNTTGDYEWINASLASSFPQISALWDDLYIYQGSGESITALATSSYFAVTWDVSQFSTDVPRFQFQEILFGANTTIGNFQFLAGDIVFAYQTVTPDFDDGDATVGLADGAGGFSTLPSLAATGGVIAEDQSGLLPTAAGTYLLFRPATGSGGSPGYNESTINVGPSAVPEPSSVVLLGLGLVGAGAAARRRTARA